MIFEEVPKDEKKIFFIKECGVFKCKKSLKYWFEDLGIYVCEEHKKTFEYVKDNCPYNGLCFIEDIEERCPYEMMDGIPCRYIPELIVKFKEIYNNQKDKIINHEKKG